MWIYKGKEVVDADIEGFTSFVYLITHTPTGKQYIGKKNFVFTRTKKVAGKTRRKKVHKESDWKDYWGSNTKLLEDVKTFGEDQFTREILYLCKTKGTASYWEAYEQFIKNALLSDNYYNEQIRVRCHRSHLKL